MSLKSKAALDAHVASFEGIKPERKQQIVGHLIALPPRHHAAVRSVLQENEEHPETRFVFGCFAQPGDDAQEQPSGEHPGLPSAA